MVKLPIVDGKNKKNVKPISWGHLTKKLDNVIKLREEEKAEKLRRMQYREDRKWYLFYPEYKLKNYWDAWMNWCLIFTCCSTPLFISFHTGDFDSWIIINIIVDVFFGLDIIVVFFSAVYDEDF